MTTAVSNAAADTLARLDHVLATTEAQPRWPMPSGCRATRCGSTRSA